MWQILRNGSHCFNLLAELKRDCISQTFFFFFLNRYSYRSETSRNVCFINMLHFQRGRVKDVCVCVCVCVCVGSCPVITQITASSLGPLRDFERNYTKSPSCLTRQHGFYFLQVNPDECHLIPFHTASKPASFQVSLLLLNGTANHVHPAIWWGYWFFKLKSKSICPRKRFSQCSSE